MSNRDYAVALSANSPAALDNVRGISGLQVAADDSELWVRASLTDENAVAALKTIPGDHYWLDSSGLLTPPGCRLATRKLTGEVRQLAWQSIDQWLAVRLPTTKWPAASGPRLQLELVASGRIVKSTAVLTTLQQLEEFVGRVPERNFAGLCFAMNEQREAFVTGSSVPPVSGRRFWMTENIAIPAGRCWSPPVDDKCLRDMFDCGSDTVIWHASERWEHLPAASIIPVTRAAVRASLFDLE